MSVVTVGPVGSNCLTRVSPADDKHLHDADPRAGPVPGGRAGSSSPGLGLLVPLHTARDMLLFEAHVPRGPGAKASRCKYLEGRPTRPWGPCSLLAAPAHRGPPLRPHLLTLHVPGPPDGIVEPDLVSPLELQALKILPLWRHQLPTERQEERKLSGSSENKMK